MPAGPGALDAEGIWQFGEADTDALASDLLNLGQASVSTQFAVDRARLAPLQRKHFQWANAAARTAQAGMSNGDDGWQSDTSALYLRVGGAWKLWSTDWVTYTPTVTNITTPGGGSTTVGKYKVVGGDYHTEVVTTLGTSPTMGTAPNVSTPVPMATYASLESIDEGSSILCATIDRPATALWLTSSTVRLGITDSSSTYAATANIAAGAPGAWAVGNQLRWKFRFRPA